MLQTTKETGMGSLKENVSEIQKDGRKETLFKTDQACRKRSLGERLETTTLKGWMSGLI
jgi:serine protease inhibitor ecotin